MAGGRSRRFGRDKRRALFNGRTLAERSLALLRSAVDGTVMVAGRGAFDRPVDAVFIEDADAGAGPLAGLVAALQRSRRGVLVLPCDAPLLRADTVSAIARAGRRSGGTVVARSRRGLEPLVAFYPKAALPILAAGLREQTRALHRLLPRLRARAIEAGDGREMHNVNSPADLERARQWTQRR